MVLLLEMEGNGVSDDGIHELRQAKVRTRAD